MAVINPPGFLQNAGATHTAEQMRNHLGMLLTGRSSASSLVPRGGVNINYLGGLFVIPTGSPSMAVQVQSGAAFIPGSEGAKQGVYFALNDANVTLSIAAAHATLNRIDLVCFKVEDQAYSGSVNTASLVVVTGTPAGSPVAPTPPNNSITLAQVSVVALDTSITAGEITDKRVYASGLGGVITCTSTTRPAVNTVISGQLLYETDTGLMQITHDNGTTWVPINLSTWQTYTPSWTATSVNPAIGNGTIDARFCQQGKTVHCYGRIIAGTTTTFGTGDWRISFPVAGHASNVALGAAFASDNGGLLYGAIACPVSTTAMFFVSSHSPNSFFSATVPFTFGNLDQFGWSYTYEVA